MLSGAGHKFSFVGTLKPEAKQEWADPRNTAHEGHGGWRLTDFTGETTPRADAQKSAGTLATWLAEAKPDTIVFLAGSSDEPDQTEEEYVRRYGTILAQIGQYRKDVRIYLGLLPSPDLGNLPEAAIKAWNLKRSGAEKAAEAAKAQGLNVTVVDTNTKFMYRTDLVDRTNPTPQGYKKIAEAFFGAMTAPEK